MTDSKGEVVGGEILSEDGEVLSEGGWPVRAIETLDSSRCRF